MNKTITFVKVSKQYRIGSGVTSLRDAFSGLSGRILKRQNLINAKEKAYIWALKDVSFSLEKGQTLGIVGPNGAGKTTILKLLSNITQPTTGNIDMKGRLSALIELGAGFHPDLSGRDNLYLNAAILGLARREIDRKYEDILEFSGLHKFMDTPVKRYSSGMYVRLGFSVAAHVEPDILLVDEVLAVGDASFRQKCINRIETLRNRGTTIVFISHNMNLVRSVCDTVLFLLNGQVEHLGPATETIRNYEVHLRNEEIRSVMLINPTQQNLVIDSSSIEIQSVLLFNGDGQPADQFNYLDNVEVRVSFKTEEKISLPSLTARIFRSDGVTTCELRTLNDGVWLPDLENEGYVSFFIEPLQLSSGAYVIEVRIQDHAGAALLSVGQSDWFQVSGYGVTVKYEYGGIYVPKVRWGNESMRQLNKQSGNNSGDGVAQ